MSELSAGLLEYDVALSYASEDRSYVRVVAERLRAEGVRLFYDEFETAKLWGVELPEIFLEIFQRKTRFTVAFISAHYVSKPWPMHEGRSALARAIVEQVPFFLPVRLDDSELPGLRPTVGYVDARSTSPEQLVAMILEKLRIMQGSIASKKEIIATISADLEEDDRKLLMELCRFGKPVPISADPGSDYYSGRLRALRNRGLISTRSGLSMRHSNIVEITNLGRIVVEEFLR